MVRVQAELIFFLLSQLRAFWELAGSIFHRPVLIKEKDKRLGTCLKKRLRRVETCSGIRFRACFCAYSPCICAPTVPAFLRLQSLHSPILGPEIVKKSLLFWFLRPQSLHF